MIGQIVIWQVKEQKPFGYIVTNGKESALLHESQCEGELQVGDDVTVFLYHDHDGRMRATMKRPLITTSSYGWVEVVDVVPQLGVFVHIGIEKDVLLSVDDLPSIPTLWPEKGDQLYCSLQVDKRGRLLAKLADEETMKQISVPAPASAFNTNVRGRIYRLIKAGSFLITDVGYIGFIHESQRRQEPRLGELVEGRIIAVKEDGTINVSLLPRKQESLQTDAETIYHYLESRGGAMPYSDKSDPEDIQARFHMSKAAFKRALGRLMKEEKVYQQDGWTYIKGRDEK
ncbi:S1 RNA binding domain [Anoxybacillus flavithermus]|uniref:CvfB family protein n=1 Tax=Anoxybacillus flavithermus TaxID=33934 RepID=UPI0007D9F078|nr:S1-like domain-containing RNA-binding protein [Anoxybacillus flavithermus]OAO76660.1 S1 RNA binding domain [Anoxybacillus flavithermus]